MNKDVSRPLLLFFLSVFVYFFSWFAVYKTGINDTLIQSEDTLPAFFLPSSLVLEGDFDLDEYFDLLVSKYPQPDGGRVPYYLKGIDGHFYSFFPILSPLLAVPVYFLPLRLGLPVTFETIGLLGHLSAALVVAASVAVMYLIFSEFCQDQKSKVKNQKHKPKFKKFLGFWFVSLIFDLWSLIFGDKALLLSLAYAFCTCSFGLSSQAMWQHGASQLMLALALYFLVRGLKKPEKVVWAGLFLSLATLSRPTGAVAVVILSVYVFLKLISCRRDGACLVSTVKNTGAAVSVKQFKLLYFFEYLFLGLLPLAVFLAVSGMSRGVLTGYIPHGSSGWTAPFPGGFLGGWFSPSKGLLTYSPVFLFSFFSVWLLVKGKFLSGGKDFPAGNPNVKCQMSNKIQSSNVKGFVFWILNLFRILDLEFRICRRLAGVGPSRHSEFGSESDGKEKKRLILKQVQDDAFFLWIFACVIAHSLVVGKWYSWYGGWAFGYRMMTDMLPFLAFLWIPFVQSPYWEKLKRWFYATAVWSLGIQLAGIGFYDGVWHNLYDDGSDLGWLFSIKNCEMAYYVRRIIAKLTGIPANQVR